jgi:pseudouridine-5'-phosphate glycosidase
MLNAYLDIQPEVAAALAAGKPVVALESTIISHGMPYPQNVETARQVEQVVRDNGAVPATIAIIDGRLKVGLDAGAWRRWAGPVMPPPSAAAATSPSCWPTRGWGRPRWPPP